MLKNLYRVFCSVLLLVIAGPSLAGHLFTQGSTNTPTWIASGTGIAVQQYGLETSSQFDVYIEQPSTTPSGVQDTSNSNWWNWSAGDVMQLSFGVRSGGVSSTQNFTVAYDAASSCTYSYCGATSLSLSGTPLASAAYALTLDLPSGTLGSSNPYTWTISALAGEFSIGGFRIGFANGKVHGSQTGPLDQSSVVSASSLPSSGGGGGSPPPIDTAASSYTDTQLNNGQVMPKFVGGTLTLGNAGTVTANFTVTDNGGSIDTAGNDTVFSGVISDDTGATQGVIKKTGSGILTLSGTNTFSGGVAVEAGKLAISADSNLGASSGGIALNGGTLQATDSVTTARAITLGANNGTLEVASSKVFASTGGITGTGQLTKTGAGILSVTGTNTYSGATSVNQGVLRLNGSLTQSSVTVASAGTLTGAGSVGGNVTLNGVIAPGNSPGTMTVAGDFTMNAASTFIAEIDGLNYSALGGAGSYDRIDLTGSSSVFTANGTVSPILRNISGAANNDFTPSVGDKFRVVTTANPAGVTGSFVSVLDPSQGMASNTRFDVLYGANYIDLVITPASLAAFAQQYGLQNVINASAAFDTIRPVQGASGSSDADRFFQGLYGLSAPALYSTLLQASGQIHAVSLGSMRTNIGSQYARIASASALKDPSEVLWVDVSGFYSRTAQDSTASSQRAYGGHAWLGMDLYHQHGQTAGLAVGQMGIRVSDASSRSNNTSNLLAGYLRGSSGQLDYDMVLGLNISSQDVRRQVDLAASTPTSNTATPWSRGLTLQVGAGYGHTLATGLDGRVFSRITMDYTHASSFVEEGSAVTALSASRQTYKTAQAVLGYELSGNVKAEGYNSVRWKVGAGSQFNTGWGSEFVNRVVGMHGASWSVSEPDQVRAVPFVNMSLSQKMSKDVTFWMNWQQSRAGSKSRRSSGHLGFSVFL